VRRLDRQEGRWYGSAPVNCDSESDAHVPDDELVRAIASGDTGALAVLYDRHAPLMLGVARRIIGGRAEAEDIVHDVFVEAWRHAADYDQSRGSVKAWLLLRTRSRAIDFRKSAGVARTTPVGDGAWLAQLVDPRGSDSEAPDRARLRGLVCALNGEQREVLLLGYFEGLSSSEIAVRMGIPIGTVKSRVAAALTALRLALRDQPADA
jgi:RNA polymerase sigma-70 factor, ECF subfamily